MSGELESRRKPGRCPECGAPKVAEVLYGLPTMDEEMMTKLDRGDIILGGCFVMERNPAWQCVECKAQIYRKESRVDP